MNTIESSVTRLLVSTKHLLESLTQWARQEADDKFVSDAYVKLGNDFRAATRAFSAARVDISDLGDVPRLLRIVLESALSDSPTQENLERFLPNIRNIIVNLLQSLKQKQATAAALAHAHDRENPTRHNIDPKSADNRSTSRKSPWALSGNELPLRSDTPGLLARQDLYAAELKRRGSVQSARTERSHEYRRESEGAQLANSQSGTRSGKASQLANDHGAGTGVESGKGSILACSGSSSHRNDQVDLANGQLTNSLPKCRLSQDADASVLYVVNNSDINQKGTDAAAYRALAQLQKNNVILRRASKRFSAYQFAKLANFNGSLLPKLSVDASFMHEAAKAEKHAEKPLDPDEDAAASTALQYIFLRIGDTTKKCAVLLPITITSLRLLFVEKFAYSPGEFLFPDIYIAEPHTNISYELEESAVQSELRSGSLVELRERNAPETTLEALDSKLAKLTSQVAAMSTKIVTEVGSQISHIEVKAPLSAPAAPAEDGPKSINEGYSKALVDFQAETCALKQIHRAKTDTLKDTLQDLEQQISALKKAALEPGPHNSHRAFMQRSYLKLSEESDLLLTKVDDLQDMMEALRKDVAQRGVRWDPCHLRTTAKEIQAAEESLQALVSYIHEGKPSWKKIWESELDKVCEEQQFFNLQDDLTRDLGEDINKIKETFDLIEKCCSEQSKQPPKRNMFAARIPLLEPSDNLHDIKNDVINEVCHVVPDHESRLEAIARAERLRQRERELQSLDQFEEELSDFVADQKLKKSGGIEELERKRQEKDIEIFKSHYGIV